MAAASDTQRDLSPRRTIGFACNQAFVFFTLLTCLTSVLASEAIGFASQSEILLLLLFMVAGFTLVRAIGPSRFPRLFTRPLLYVYAVVASAGLLAHILMAAQDNIALAAASCALMGIPNAFMLTAWGRAFGSTPTENSVSEVFTGSLVGALVCLVFSFAVDSTIAVGAMCLLPIASAFNIPDGNSNASASQPPSNDAESAQSLSAKILAGTFLFGVAGGLLLLYRTPDYGWTLSVYQVSLILYGAFLIGGLSLLLSDGFGRGAALNKSYRLAVFVMMVGVMIVPWPLFATSILPGKAVVLAGFFGLEAVLISLFLVLAEITEVDCGLSFSTGFLALFAGQLVGACGSTFAADAIPESSLAFAIAAMAGTIILIGYIFLFTERDFDQLSQLVIESDSFETVCQDITDRFGLSKRESEILAFALRGRTSERIAQELVISKSTVDTHLRRIYAKCDVHSRQELLDLAGL